MTTPPHIKLIATPFVYAFYDVNRNQLVTTNKETFDKLSVLLSGDVCQIEECLEDETIKNMMKAGFLSCKRPEKIQHPQTDFVSDILQGSLELIILQVTQNCNFRCSYCAYTDSRENRQRGHMFKNMDLETAKASLEFFFKHSSSRENLSIGYYGGEPLLNFELIKEITEYACNRMPHKEIRFSITTNGSIFNRDILDFFTKYNFLIMISVDGDKETHDKNRKHIDGSGTFDTIIQNLNLIQKDYPEIFENIIFNMVMDMTANYDCYKRVFVEYDAIKKEKMQVNLIDTFLTNNTAEAAVDSVEKYEYDVFLGFMAHIKRVGKENITQLALSYIDSVKDLGKKMISAHSIPSTFAPSGPCIPGLLRVFVDIHGNLFPCERCSETSAVMKIGNLHDEYDLERVKQLLNVGQISEDECKNCWAIRHCTMCAAKAEDGESLSKSVKMKSCWRIMESIESRLRDYLTLMSVKQQ